jgi:hypothetical protein
MRNRIGAERGWSPMQRADFDREIDQGSLYVGSPETVSREIVSTVKTLSLSRFDRKFSAGELSHDRIMHCIALSEKKSFLVCVKYWHPEHQKQPHQQTEMLVFACTPAVRQRPTILNRRSLIH